LGRRGKIFPFPPEKQQDMPDHYGCARNSIPDFVICFGPDPAQENICAQLPSAKKSDQENHTPKGLTRLVGAQESPGAAGSSATLHLAAQKLAIFNGQI